MSIRYKWRSIDHEMGKKVSMEELRQYLSWEFVGLIEFITIGGRSYETK
ncbi:hypothetical protein ACFQI7_27395 [Paenibacillus allorhizosphaerae]|nr:hypothetical protein [Paenibacillus allorhizosphaerae]